MTLEINASFTLSCMLPFYKKYVASLKEWLDDSKSKITRPSLLLLVRRRVLLQLLIIRTFITPKFVVRTYSIPKLSNPSVIFVRPHTFEKGKCIVVVRRCLVAVIVLIVHCGFVQSADHRTNHKCAHLSLLLIELDHFFVRINALGVLHCNIFWGYLEKWGLARHEVFADFVLGHEPLSNTIALTVVNDMRLRVEYG